MNHLQRFTQYDYLQESKESEWNNDGTWKKRQLHTLMLNIFMLDFQNWVNGNTYLTIKLAAPTGSKKWDMQSIRDLKSSGETVDSIIEKALAGQKVHYSDLLFFLKEFVNPYYAVSLMPTYGKSGPITSHLDMMILPEIIGRRHPSNPRKQKSISCCAEANYNFIKSCFWSGVTFDEMRKAWKNGDRYFFDETYLKKCANDLKKSIIKFWAEVSIVVDGQDPQRKEHAHIHPAIGSDGTLSLKRLKELPDKLFLHMMMNSKFLIDVLKEIKSKKKFIPFIISAYMLMFDYSVDVPISYYSPQFIDCVEAQPDLLDLCKKTIPKLYNKIKSKRQDSEKWKTDLSADLGSLGF